MPPSRSQDVQVEQVLMLVKTYPTPSARYGELVCTAGIRLRDNAWVRIYPYPFRQLSSQERFVKGDVLSIPLFKATDDPRNESYKTYDFAAVEKVGHFGTQHGWRQRMRYIRPSAVNSVGTFKKNMLPDAASWGPSILPVEVRSGSATLTWEHQGDWSEDDAKKLKKAEEYVKTNLFVSEEVSRYFQLLKRVPYQFRLGYVDASGEEYRHLVLDWEIAQLYFNSRKTTKN